VTGGFLNDLKLSAAPTDPNFLPEGKYPAFVQKLTTRDTKSGPALIITYKISEHDAENQGKVKTEFKSLPVIDPATGEFKDDDSKRNAAFLKQRLISLGVPDGPEMDEMKEEDLLGTPVWITIMKTGDYYNIRQVELREEESASGIL
jgi:hypothetical protein